MAIYFKGPQSRILHAKARACLHREEMPPFPLALGFNAAIPPRSRVQLIACVAPPSSAFPGRPARAALFPMI